MLQEERSSRIRLLLVPPVISYTLCLGHALDNRLKEPAQWRAVSVPGGGGGGVETK